MDAMQDLMTRAVDGVVTDTDRLVQGAVRRGRLVRRRRRAAVAGVACVAASAAAAVAVLAPAVTGTSSTPQVGAAAGSPARPRAATHSLAPRMPSAAQLDARLQEALPGESKPQPAGTRRWSDTEVTASRVLDRRTAGQVTLTVSRDEPSAARSTGAAHKCEVARGCHAVAGGWLFEDADARPDGPVDKGLRATVVTFVRADGFVVQARALNAAVDTADPTGARPVLTLHEVQRLARARAWLR